MGGLSCPTPTPHKKLILCGTGILPVLENGARCQFKPKFSVIIATLRYARSTFSLLHTFFSIPQPPACFATESLVSIFEQGWDV